MMRLHLNMWIITIQLEIKGRKKTFFFVLLAANEKLFLYNNVSVCAKT
jgi:hypothetical protein